MIKSLQKKFILTAMIAVTILLLLMLGVINVVNAISIAEQNVNLLSEVTSSYENPDKTGEIIAENMLSNEGESGGDSAGDSSMDEAVDESNDKAVETNNVDAEEESRENSDENSGSDGNTDEGNSEGDSGMELSENETLDEGGSSVFPRNPFEGRRQGGFMVPEITANALLGAVYFVVDFNSSGEILTADMGRVATVTEEEAVEMAGQAYKKGESTGKIDDYRYAALSNDVGNTAFFFLDCTNEKTSTLRILGLSALAGLAGWGIMFLIVYLLSKAMIVPIAANIEKQKNFITDASHELKTPLAIIMANTEAMEMRQGENKWTVNIKSQTKRLSNLMTNMLTLSKAEDPYSKNAAEEVDISALLSEYTEMFIESGKNKNLKLNRNWPDACLVKGNKVQYGQLLSILIDNAIRYCADGSTVSVDVDTEEKHAEMRISNICDALPECEPEMLFERFYRPDSSRNSEQGGNGIGLAAARAIMNHYGGTIKCNFEDENKIVFICNFKR